MLSIAKYYEEYGFITSGEKEVAVKQWSFSPKSYSTETSEKKWFKNLCWYLSKHR